MFERHRKMEKQSYDRENEIPVLRCSICNGEQVAGFKNIHTGWPNPAAPRACGTRSRLSPHIVLPFGIVFREQAPVRHAV